MFQLQLHGTCAVPAAMFELYQKLVACSRLAHSICLHSSTQSSVSTLMPSHLGFDECLRTLQRFHHRPWQDPYEGSSSSVVGCSAMFGVSTVIRGFTAVVWVRGDTFGRGYGLASGCMSTLTWSTCHVTVVLLMFGIWRGEFSSNIAIC